jgi:hypothetical protein
MWYFILTHLLCHVQLCVLHRVHCVWFCRNWMARSTTPLKLKKTGQNLKSPVIRKVEGSVCFTQPYHLLILVFRQAKCVHLHVMCCTRRGQ